MRDILVHNDKRKDMKVFSAADIAFFVARARDTLDMKARREKRDTPSAAQMRASLSRIGIKGTSYSLNDIRKAATTFTGRTSRKWVRAAWYAKLYIEERYKQEYPELVNMELTMEEARIIRNFRLTRDLPYPEAKVG